MPRPKPRKIGVSGRKRRGRYDTGNYLPEDLARKVVRQHPDESLWFVVPLCGPRVVAEELIHRYRVKRQQENIKYDRHERDHAITQAARMVSEVGGRRLDPKTLRNWLNRSKRARTPKRQFKS
jgi:hypothetical protein